MVITDHLINFPTATDGTRVCLHTYRPHLHTSYDMYYHGDNSGLTQLQQQQLQHEQHPKHQHHYLCLLRYYSLSFANFGAAAAAPILYSVAQFPVRRPVSPVRHVRRASPTPPGRPVRPERTTAPRRISRPFRIVVHDRGLVSQAEMESIALSCRPQAAATWSSEPAASPASRTIVLQLAPDCPMELVPT